MCAENTPFPSMLDLGHRADRQWNANVCMLTNSTAPWMGFVITPHHACCIGPVSPPPPFSPPALHFSFLFFHPPPPPSFSPLAVVPLGQSCGHTTWLLAAQECSWQKQPEAPHVEKIQSAHCNPPPTTLTAPLSSYTPHFSFLFLPLTNRSTAVVSSYCSPVKGGKKMARRHVCLHRWGFFRAFAAAGRSASPTNSERRRQLLSAELLSLCHVT